MYYLHHSGTAFAAIVAGTIASTHAQAGVRVGGVTSVVHDVASSVSGQATTFLKMNSSVPRPRAAREFHSLTRRTLEWVRRRE